MIPKFISKIFNPLFKFISKIFNPLFKFISKIFNPLFKFKEAKKEKLNKELEEEFKGGKIILPVDKRDFENLKEFKEKTDHIPKIKEKINDLDKDFKKFNPFKKKEIKEETNKLLEKKDAK